MKGATFGIDACISALLGLPCEFYTIIYTYKYVHSIFGESIMVLRFKSR